MNPAPPVTSTDTPLFMPFPVCLNLADVKTLASRVVQPIWGTAHHQRFLPVIGMLGQNDPTITVARGVADNWKQQRMAEAIDDVRENEAMESGDGGPGTDAKRIVREAFLRDVALLAASDWFDPAWYLKAYPDVDVGGVEPAEHYIVYGWREGRDPGPFFSSQWYLATNPDVAISDLNPLIHYLSYGRNEGRAPNDTGFDPQTRAARHAAMAAAAPASEAAERQAKEAAIVRTSSLFDADWYRVRHASLMVDGDDPALHYVVAGADKQLDPGPRFSSSWYLERHPDVAAIGINPLVHYIRYGRGEGREAGPENIANILDPDAAAEAARTRPHEGGKLDPAIERINVAMRGTTLGLIDVVTAERLPAFVQSLLAFARLHGWNEAETVTLRGGTISVATPPLDILNWTSNIVSSTAGIELVDAWLTNDVTLRLRWEAIGEGQFATHRSLHFHQASPDGLLACGNSALHGDSPTFIDATLINPYKPLLVTVTDADGLLCAAVLLPFPSLLRGGAHHAEIAAAGERASRAADQLAFAQGATQEWIGWTGIDKKPSLFSVEVEIGVANGSERLFDPFVRDWLAEIFGIEVIARGEAADVVLTEHLRGALAWPRSVPLMRRRKEGEGVLRLPADSLPTIAVLASRRLAISTGATPGAFLVADAATARPRLQVQVPPIGMLMMTQPTFVEPLPTLIARSSDSVPGDGNGGMIPLAIRFKSGTTQPPLAYLPVAPDADRTPFAGIAKAVVSALVTGRGDLRILQPLLASLADQTVAADIDVIIVWDAGEEDAAVLEQYSKALFGDRFRLEPAHGRSPATCLNEAIDLAGGDHLLFIDGSMLMHDKRYVATLVALLAEDKVFSAGSPQVCAGSKGNDLSIAAGAYFPTGIMLARAPHLLFEEPAAPALPIEGTLPVVANSMRAMMVKTATLRVLGKLDERCHPLAGYDLELGLRAVREGLINLNTTAVTISDTTQRSSNWSQDLIAVNYLPPQRWQDLVESVTVIRELH